MFANEIWLLSLRPSHDASRPRDKPQTSARLTVWVLLLPAYP
jgi:hypothetical protein